METISPNFAVVFQDDHLVVVHKSAGLLTTPALGQGDCLVDLLEAHLDRQRFGRYRLGVVHRLDRDTSGLLVFSRSPRVTPHLARQFAAHRVERAYDALASGDLSAQTHFTVNLPIAGKKAISHIEVVTPTPLATLLSVRLETGRTNQIRRHLAEHGHPLFGDVRFGGPAWNYPGIALHARLLGFEHPITKSVLRFEAPNAAWLPQPRTSNHATTTQQTAP